MRDHNLVSENLQYANGFSLSLKVTIKVAENRDRDVVTLANGSQYYFPAWLAATERAARFAKMFIELPDHTATKEQCTEFYAACKWLHWCGVRMDGDFDGDVKALLDEILPKLRMPADSPMASARCAKCGSRIWGREAVVTGLGSECRSKRVRAEKLIRVLNRRETLLAPAGV